MFPAPGGDPGAGVTTCYRHPHRPTALRCTQCNRPTCAECLVATPRGLLCPDDAAAVDMGVAPIGSFGQNVQKIPYVTGALFAINIVMYLVTAFWPGGRILFNTDSTAFHRLLLSPVLVGEDHEYYRLLSSVFLHVGMVHLVLNMVALGIIGPGLERLLGWWRFLAIYALGALGGAVAIVGFGEVGLAVADASAPILGLVAAAIVLARVVGFDTRSLWITVLINFVITFTIHQISILGHIGGFVCGGLAVGAVLEWSLVRKPPQSRRPQKQIFGLVWIAVALITFGGLRLYDIAKLNLIQGG